MSLQRDSSERPTGFAGPVGATLVAACLACLAWVAPAAQTTGRQFYAAPSGLATNDGSIARPLDLATALSAASPVRAGDTLWLRGGRYLGNFTSVLAGSTTAPIVVRQYPGERATLDAATANRSAPGLAVNGSDTWYWGLEVTDTSTSRVNSGGFNNPPLRATSVDVYGPRTRFINMVVHDGLQGFGFWSTAVDAEIYGTLIYHVGVEAPDRGHGHSVYVQNATGWKRIVDNLMFYSFSFGIHAYTEGGRVDNIHMEGNTVVGAGVLSARSGAKANILTGGGDVADFSRVLNNVTYYPTLDGRGLDLDYGAGCTSPDIRGNYVVSETPVKVAGCTNVTMTGNTFYGYTGALATLYPNNTYHATRPTGVRTFVRPNAYEAGRAHITVVNWDLASAVPVNLSAANLAVGTRFEIRDAQNFFGAPVVSGTYAGGTVSVPMTGLSAVAPIGNAPIAPAHTAPQFGAFVLLPVGAVTPTPGALRIDGVAPTSGSAAGGVVVTLTGAGFAPGASVQVDGVAATAVVVPNSSTMSFIAPPHTPGIVDIRVASAGQQATRPAAFRYDSVAPTLNPAAVSGSLVSLRWTAGANTPVRGYAVVGGRTPGASEFGPYAMGIATAVTAAVGPGPYYARVLADTNWGLLTSNEVRFTVGPSSPPPPPTLAPAAISGRTVSLSWSGSDDAASYVVVARLTPAGAPVATLPVTAAALTVAAPPGQYYVTVVGVNGLGVGRESNQIVVTVR